MTLILPLSACLHGSSHIELMGLLLSWFLQYSKLTKLSLPYFSEPPYLDNCSVLGKREKERKNMHVEGGVLRDGSSTWVSARPSMRVPSFEHWLPFTFLSLAILTAATASLSQARPAHESPNCSCNWSNSCHSSKHWIFLALWLFPRCHVVIWCLEFVKPLYNPFDWIQRLSSVSLGNPFPYYPTLGVEWE